MASTAQRSRFVESERVQQTTYATPGGSGHGRRRGGQVDWRELVAIAAGGVVGALVRTALERAAAAPPGMWPWSTFGVNIAGCLLLGYAVTRLQERLPVSLYKRPFVGTGLCGALTTFSTMQLELLRMLDGGRWLEALAYALASVGAGFSGIVLASKAARQIAPWRR